VISDATLDGVTSVLERLRAPDEAELRATILEPGIEPADLAADIFGRPGPKWEARSVDGVAQVVGGFLPIWPGFGALWSLGTDRWPDVGLEVTRFVSRFMLPQLASAGFHRVEARPMAVNEAALRWLMSLGFTPEAVLAQFGRAREDFFLFAWTADGRPDASH
jgi:hypothetical protein